jgi:hypothetical protein
VAADLQLIDHRAVARADAAAPEQELGRGSRPAGRGPGLAARRPLDQRTGGRSGPPVSADLLAIGATAALVAVLMAVAYRRGRRCRPALLPPDLVAGCAPQAQCLREPAGACAELALLGRTGQRGRVSGVVTR